MTREEMIEDSLEKGSKWFAASSMNSFGTIIETEPDEYGRFITSEQDSLGCAWNGERRYTVRQYDWDTGHVETISEFGGFYTLDGAKDYLR